MQRVPVTPGTDGRVAHPEAAPPSAPATRPRSSWYALHTCSRAEFSVQNELEKQGIEAWTPATTETHRWSDREKEVKEPVFPGYVFARLGLFQFEIARRIRGVTTILGTHPGVPEAIPDDEIDEVRRVLASPRPLIHCPHVAGAAVRVARGPLAGVTGVVRKIAGETVVSVGIRLMNRSLTVSIDASDLQKAA